MLTRKRQRGVTLIELMVGLVVGLIVLSAVIYVFLLTVSTARDVRNGALSSKEATYLADLISGEIRRIGYSSASVAVSSTIFDIPASANPCLVYTYDKDPSIPGVTDDGYFAIYSSGGAVFLGLGASLADCSVTSSEQLSSVLVSASISSFSSSIVSAANGSTGHVIDYGVSVEVRSDGDWTSSLTKSTKIRNDEM